MRVPAPYRFTYRDRITLRKAVERSLLRGLRRRPHPRITLLDPGDPGVSDTEPAPNSDWDTELPPSDPPTDPDHYDPSSRTVL